MRMTRLMGRMWEAASSEPPGMQARPLQWNTLKRLLFRFCFCYYAVWITLNGNATIWEAVPGLGPRLEGWLWSPLGGFSQWMGRYAFHLHGPQAQWISRGVSDSLLVGILTGCYVLVALCAATTWTLLDRKRTEYQTLYAWLRFALRLTLGIALVTYAMTRLLPFGEQPLDLAALNTPTGSLSPALVLWTVANASSGLRITAGVCDLLVGAMLLYRRTALFGALLAFFGTAVLLAAEIWFRMPVRIFTGHVLLAAGSVILPDLPAVVRFFWKHEAVAAAGLWLAPARRRTFYRTTAVVQGVLIALMLGHIVFAGSEHIYAARTAHREPLPLLGGWTMGSGARQAGQIPFRSKDGDLIQSIWFNRQIGSRDFQLTLRSANGRFWQGFASADLATHTLMLRGQYTRARTYRVRWAAADSMELQALPFDGQNKFADETLTRIRLPQTYRLLAKHPPLVDQYGYAR